MCLPPWETTRGVASRGRQLKEFWLRRRAFPLNGTEGRVPVAPDVGEHIPAAQETTWKAFPTHDPAFPSHGIERNVLLPLPRLGCVFWTVRATAPGV